MIDLSPLLLIPENPCSSVVFSVPHSGRAYPEAFLKRSVLDEMQIRSSEDAYVDEFFACGVEHGAPVLIARAPRAYVDLNRTAGDLDPGIIRDVRVSGANPRVSSGLGIIPRVVANGQAIRRGKMTLFEAEARLDAVYFPYHETLEGLLKAAAQKHGEALLIDCHSMPREAVANIRTGDGRVPDIILGDRFGASCAPALMDQVQGAFEANGFAVLRNTPFAGVEILRRYGRPSKGQNAVQVEINRGLYWNERLMEKTVGFSVLQKRLQSVISNLSLIGQGPQMVAAE